MNTENAGHADAFTRSKTFVPLKRVVSDKETFGLVPASGLFV